MLARYGIVILSICRSVCRSVCPSVTRMLCDEIIENIADILIPHERVGLIILVL